MFKIDENLLKELGLGDLPTADKEQMRRQIYETLEMRVGMKLAEQMSDQQLNEFEGFIDKNDEAGALKWLETNFPDYKQVVAGELDKLKTEIKKSAPQIVAESLKQQASSSSQTDVVDSPAPQLPQEPTNNQPLE